VLSKLKIKEMYWKGEIKRKLRRKMIKREGIEKK